MALVADGRTSLICFLLGLSVLCIPLVGSFNKSIHNIFDQYWRYILALNIAVVNGSLLYVYKGRAYQVAIRSSLLGLAIGVGIILSLSVSSLRLFGWYLTWLALFHWSEFFTTAVANPKNLSLESFLLDHSKEYHIAAVASVVEFVVEWAIFPGWKQPSWLSIIGLVMVIGGEVMRKGAMLTARTNFNHYVQHVKHDDHILVTRGLYSFCRHPSYVGWFWWSVGTQVMLCNPICMVGYACASWSFFKQRIEIEEVTLLNFFGEDYIAYQKRVGTGLPFIHGYRFEL